MGRLTGLRRQVDQKPRRGGRGGLGAFAGSGKLGRDKVIKALSVCFPAVSVLPGKQEPCSTLPKSANWV